MGAGQISPRRCRPDSRLNRRTQQSKQHILGASQTGNGGNVVRSAIPGVLAAVMLAAGCGAAANAAHPAASLMSSPKSPSASPVPKVVPATPRQSLRQIARTQHATFIAGPRRGPAGTFAAFSVVRSVRADHDPGNTLTLLRWTGGAWTVESRLHATRANGFWDFPENNLAADTVEGASSEAPVFDGAEGGGGGFGLLVAVRQHGRWLWAHFAGCAVPGECPPLVTRSNTATDGQVVRGQVVGLGFNCRPDCADSSRVYRNQFAWDTERATFVLSRQTLTTASNH